jgi:hypothetical protein
LTSTTSTTGSLTCSTWTCSAADRDVALSDRTVLATCSATASVDAVITASTRTLAAVTFSSMSAGATPGRVAARLVLYADWSNSATVPATTMDTVTFLVYCMPDGAGGSPGGGGVRGGGTPGGLGEAVDPEPEASTTTRVTNPTSIKVDEPPMHHLPATDPVSLDTEMPDSPTGAGRPSACSESMDVYFGLGEMPSAVKTNERSLEARGIIHSNPAPAFHVIMFTQLSYLH